MKEEEKKKKKKEDGDSQERDLTKIDTSGAEYSEYLSDTKNTTHPTIPIMQLNSIFNHTSSVQYKPNIHRLIVLKPLKCPFKSRLLSWPVWHPPDVEDSGVTRGRRGQVTSLPCALWCPPPASWHGGSWGCRRGLGPPPWTGRAGTGPAPAPRDWWDWRAPLRTWRMVLERDGVSVMDYYLKYYNYEEQIVFVRLSLTV